MSPRIYLFQDPCPGAFNPCPLGAAGGDDRRGASSPALMVAAQSVAAPMLQLARFDLQGVRGGGIHHGRDSAPNRAALSCGEIGGISARFGGGK